jgi:hypothetical protein
MVRILAIVKSAQDTASAGNRFAKGRRSRALNTKAPENKMFSGAFYIRWRRQNLNLRPAKG